MKRVFVVYGIVVGHAGLGAMEISAAKFFRRNFFARCRLSINQCLNGGVIITFDNIPSI
jgi:hypothetical protein